MPQTIGVRELQTTTATYIKQARDGQTFVVTWHGQEAAALVPAVEYRRWERETHMTEDPAPYTTDQGELKDDTLTTVALMLAHGDRAEAARLLAQAAADLLRDR